MKLTKKTLYKYTNTLNLIIIFFSRVWCAPNYYGKDCNTLCIEQDNNEKGHFKCDPETGAKVCLPGWNGHKCLSTGELSLKLTFFQSIFYRL